MENNIEIGEKFLPIGTVVILKEGKKELMITGYCTMPLQDLYDKNGKVEKDPNELTVFDYCGCFYPEGIISSDHNLAFNHDQIGKILFKGYETEKSKEISTKLNEALNEVMKELTNEEVIPTEETKEDSNK